ncbi:MAG: alpha-amylase family glycosyl hydrolase, partial [Chloroflexota bacterium]
MLQHPDPAWMQRAAQMSLSRILPRLESVITDPAARQVFTRRLHEQFPRLFELLFQLYGHHYDFFYHLETMIRTAADYYCNRPDDLQALDTEREQDRTWYASEKMVGATLYVDLFAGDFNGLRERIPYLQELGVTYLHLMPVFRTPATNSDGGYAVSSYRETNPKLGTIDDLRELATEFRRAGISLVLDFIFNHTSNEHDWALAARSGDERYRDYYRVFPDRTVPDQYEATLREIFPEQSPGNFT